MNFPVPGFTLALVSFLTNFSTNNSVWEWNVRSNCTASHWLENLIWVNWPLVFLVGSGRSSVYWCNVYLFVPNWLSLVQAEPPPFWLVGEVSVVNFEVFMFRKRRCMTRFNVSWCSRTVHESWKSRSSSSEIGLICNFWVVFPC
jgi:hypothetical protein